MNRIQRTLIILGCAGALLPISLAAEKPPAIELEAAMAREQTDGDLNAAMAAYRRIAEDSAAPRAVRAKALLQQAQAQERLGQGAQAVYQRIAREFADQPAAAEARKRLARLQSPGPSTMTQRKLDLPAVVGNPEGAGGRPVTDGKTVIYFDSATRTLTRSDAAGGNRVALYQHTAPSSPFWIASRDLTTVLVIARLEEKSVWTLVNADGTGQRKAGVFPYTWEPKDWSWDKRAVLVAEHSAEKGKGEVRILRVNLADGQATEFGRTTSVPYMMKLSPDGQAVAYGLGNRIVSRLFVIGSAGQAPSAIGEGGGLLDWTKDGRRLAVTLDRNGSTALHLVTIANGKAVGEPKLIRYGSFRAGMTTPDGGLVYTAIPASGLVSVHTSSLNEQGRVENWTPLPLIGANGGNPAPAFSPDDKWIVYTASYDGAGQTARTVRMRNIETGEDREIYRNAGRTILCTWPGTEPRVVCTENDRRAETTRLLSIGVPTGEVKTLHSWPDFRFGYYASGDGKTIYGYTAHSGFSGLARWDLASGKEIPFALKAGEREIPYSVTTDGRWLLARNPTVPGLRIRPIDGGEWRTLMVGAGFQMMSSPNGEWMYYHGRDGEGRNGFYRVPTAGGAAERIGDFPSRITAGTLTVSHDGRKFVAVAFDTMGEWWLLENYEAAVASH